MGTIIPFFSNHFSPLEIASLALWLDAHDLPSISLSGSTVSQWSDKSGKGNHATQALAVRQPLYVASAIKNRPALRGFHDGSNASQLAIADATSLDYTTCTAFAVCQRVADLAATEIVAGKYTDIANQLEHNLYIEASDYVDFQTSPDGTFASRKVSYSSVPWVINTPAILQGTFNGTQTIVKLNKTQGATIASTSIFNGTSPYFLFSRNGYANPFAGTIGEYLFFTRALSADESTAITNYLIHKWGLV
jgi:hypothetical protein